MINMFEVNETNKMIDPGESGCPYDHHGNQSSGLHMTMIWRQLNQNIYDKITPSGKGSGADRRSDRTGIWHSHRK